MNTPNDPMMMTADDFVRAARHRDDRDFKIVPLGNGFGVSDGVKRPYPLPRRGGPLSATVVESMVNYFGLAVFHLDFHLDPREDH